MPSAPLTIGIEEEYQIVHPETRQLSAYVQKLIDQGRMVLGDQIKYEFMQSQIEVGSKVCQNIAEAREEVIRLRRTVNDLAGEHGRAIVAASTHPFSKWQEQPFSEGERYDDLLTTMQDAARRLLIFGMHVHIGIGTDDDANELTIDLLNQLRYFLPHILALSTSSPFWHGRNTGMKSYRSLIFENLPRSGIPPVFTSYHEYDTYVALLAKVGAFGDDGKRKPSDKKDPTKIWWDARPHPNWGTLEVRVSDMCTTVDETIAIAALIQSLVAKLLKLRNENRSWRIYPSYKIAENKWRAVRYGVEGKLIDYGKETDVSMQQLADEMLAVVDEVVDDLGPRAEVERNAAMCRVGSSADRQIAIYEKSLADGATEQEALYAIVDQLIAETRQGWE
jgi:carboxylate-amine ligase